MIPSMISINPFLKNPIPENPDLNKYKNHCKSIVNIQLSVFMDDF